MNHPTQEQLILHYYGEDGEPIGAHLAACEACRDEYRKLQRVLNTVEAMPVPERAAGYETAVWKRLEPRIARRPGRWWTAWLDWRRMAVAAALASLIVAAFLAGRYARTPSRPPAVAANPVRERILLVAVGDHLERSQVVLAELSNLGAGKKDRVDISYEQRAAQDLVESSRLYRMSAANTGDTATANVLDELERVLLDIAHGPSEVTGAQLELLQKRMADDGILFKVRVYATQVEHRENRL